MVCPLPHPSICGQTGPTPSRELGRGDLQSAPQAAPGGHLMGLLEITPPAQNRSEYPGTSIIAGLVPRAGSSGRTHCFPDGGCSDQIYADGMMSRRLARCVARRREDGRSCQAARHRLRAFWTSPRQFKILAQGPSLSVRNPSVYRLDRRPVCLRR